MANDLKVYNHLKYQQTSTENEDDFVDFLFENTEVVAPELENEDAWNRLQTALDKKANRPTVWLKVAASVAILSVLSISLFLYSPKVEMLNVASNEERISVNFPDGSYGVLNYNSSFSYPETFGEARKVSLKGEAYFDIKKSTKEFIIDVNGVDVKVLGTAFNLLSKDKEVVLYVDRGLVAFEKNGIQTQVPAGKEAIFSKVSNTVEIKEIASSNIMSWRNGVFNFNNTPLEKALQDLSKYYKVKFELDNDKLKTCKISATFENQSLKDVLSTLSTILDVKTSTNQKTVKISGQGC